MVKLQSLETLDLVWSSFHILWLILLGHWVLLKSLPVCSQETAVSDCNYELDGSTGEEGATGLL